MPLLPSKANTYRIQPSMTGKTSSIIRYSVFKKPYNSEYPKLFTSASIFSAFLHIGQSCWLYVE